MVETITIPKLSHDGSVWDDNSVVGKPGWFQVVDGAGKTAKPIIRCNCGSVRGIGLHHVHADGTVTASFSPAKAFDDGYTRI